MSTAALTSGLAGRLRPLLEGLYGERAAEALGLLVGVAEAHQATSWTPRPRAWDERDTVLIAYADHVNDPEHPPLAALRALADDLQLHRCFSLVHLLPFFPSTSDEGFSVSDFDRVADQFGSWADVAALAMRFELAMDLVLNHVSASHPWFLAFLRGEEPERRFIRTASPTADLSATVRPRPTPVLTPFETADGVRHVWTTFSSDQVDLDYREPAVLAAMASILLALVRRGARMVRLDAVGFVWKEEGTPNIHLPGTHLVVRALREVVEAVAPGTWLLTETNVPHHENITYWDTGREAHLVYNFALPPLLLDAVVTGDAGPLRAWLSDLAAPPAGCSFLNFTASHDGIGVRPVADLLPPGRVDALVDTVRARGGLVSTRPTPTGEQPYELNITYAAAVAAGDRYDVERFLLTQALALAFRGIPAVYLPSLVGAGNDADGVTRTGQARSINRHRYRRDEWDHATRPASRGAGVLDRYRHLLAVRRTRSAFHPDAAQEPVPVDDPAVVAFLRSGERDEVLVVANLAARRASVDIGAMGLVAEAPDLISGLDIVELSMTVSLDPYQVAWLPVRPCCPEELVP